MKYQGLLCGFAAAALGCGAAQAEDLIVQRSAHSVQVNGNPVVVSGYQIHGNNYFKLRDIAAAVNGTGSQFDISWDETQHTIALLEGQTYTPVGGEQEDLPAQEQLAERATATITKDGQLTNYDGYSIQGNNYYKLRDVADSFGIQVAWDDRTQSVNLVTESDKNEETPAEDNTVPAHDGAPDQRVLENNRMKMQKERTDAAALDYALQTPQNNRGSWEMMGADGHLMVLRPAIYADQNGELLALAKKITAGLSSDRDKAKAIHDWIAENIWYDMDMYHTKKVSLQDPLDVLKNKRAVCDGYAKLTTALLRNAGIPAKEVEGLIIRGTHWSDPITDGAEAHAWTEAYIDGKWISIDTTWDSQNKYENQKYGEKKSGRSIYFDPSVETFSKDHFIQLNGEAGIPPEDIYFLPLEEQRAKFENQGNENRLDIVTVINPNLFR